MTEVETKIQWLLAETITQLINREAMGLEKSTAYAYGRKDAFEEVLSLYCIQQPDVVKLCLGTVKNETKSD